MTLEDFREVVENTISYICSLEEEYAFLLKKMREAKAEFTDYDFRKKLLIKISLDSFYKTSRILDEEKEVNIRTILDVLNGLVRSSYEFPNLEKENYDLFKDILGKYFV